MYKIEFNDEMTLEGILESFKNLKEAEMKAYIEIDGIRIYSDNIDLEEEIKVVYEKYHVKHKKNIVENEKDNLQNRKNIEEDLDVKIVAENYLNAFYLSQNVEFIFQLGTVLEYTKDEYKKMIVELKINDYGHNNKDKNEAYKYLNYEASILLILANESSKVQKRFQLQQLINSIPTNNIEKEKLSFAIREIITYTIYGDELKELLYTNILAETVEEKKKTYEKIKKEKQS